MNATQLHHALASRNIPSHMSRHCWRMILLETVSSRLTEIDVLILKTECAIKLDINKYWGNRHKETRKNLKELKRINETILSAMNAQEIRMRQ